MGFYDVLDDTSRGMTGEYGQLNVYDSTLNKYVLFLPLETLPSVVGSVNTFENNVTTSRSIGKIKGKKTIDDKEVTFLWCRDNIERINKFVGKQLDFLVSYKDGTGWKFSGEVTYKPDDGTASDKLTGTLTIIASNVEDVATTNVLDLMAKTCVITSGSFPSELYIAPSKEESISLKFSNATGTATAKSDNTSITATITGSTLKITGTQAGNGIVTVTTNASGEASWEYHILVVVE